MDKQAALKRIYNEYARDRAFDSLREHGGPKRVCPGRGSMTPRIVIVGEAPGEAESVHRAPFRGAAGQRVLTPVLESIGLTRSDVFITNLVKYRPTIGELRIRNRTPRLPEMLSSWPYLERELAVFPGVPVVSLGKVPLYVLHWDPTMKISYAHGTSWQFKSHTVFAWYHPAVALYDETMMPTLLADAARFRDEVLAQ